MKDKALRAQRATIKGVLTRFDSCGQRSVARWADIHFYLSAFSATTFAAHAHTGYDSAKRTLEKMARDGVLKRVALTRAVMFRFDRETCDRLAALVTQELLDEGLQMESSGRKAA